MKQIIKVIVGASVFALSVFFQVAGAQSIVIRVAYDENNQSHLPLIEQLEKLIDQRFDGRVTLRLFTYEPPFDGSKALEALKKNRIDLAIPSLSQLTHYSQRFKIFDLPFVFYSQAAAERFLRGQYGVRLSNSLYYKGFKGLGFLNGGMKQLAANKKILRPYEMVGLSVGVFSSSEVLMQQYEQIGARSVHIKQAQAYQLLKKQQLDAHENDFFNIEKNKLQAFQPFIIESNHSYQGYLVVMSTQFWTAQDEAMLDELTIVTKEAINFANRVVNQNMERAKQAIIASGKSEVYRLTAEQRQTWSESLQVVWEIFEDDIGTELIKIAASER